MSEQPRISYSGGKGKLRHNNRDIVSSNVDPNRVKDNITFISMPVRVAYDKIFKEAQEEYDAKQKRNDRKIHDYFDKLFGNQPHADDLIVQNNNKQKSFYEYVVGIGDKDTMGYETNPESAAIAEKILQEYAEGFQKRNLLEEAAEYYSLANKVMDGTYVQSLCNDEKKQKEHRYIPHRSHGGMSR